MMSIRNRCVMFMCCVLVFAGLVGLGAAPTPDPVKSMIGPALSAPGLQPAASQDRTPEIPPWGAGLSVLAPGMPIALKVVYQPEEWGFQIEANYFYYLAMLRLDARRILKGANGNDLYGFVGVTASHIDDGLSTATSVKNLLLADLGVGGEIHFGKHRRFGIGIEGGLLIPFYSNQELDQFDNSGLMVANAFFLFRF